MLIEEIIRNYLNDDHLSAPVYLEIPKSAPPEFYVMEKTGGSENNQIDSSTFALQAYAQTMYRAAELANQAAVVMKEGLITLDQITKVSVQGPYNFTDTTKKNYRYQSVCTVTHYSQEV